MVTARSRKGHMKQTSALLCVAGAALVLAADACHADPAGNAARGSALFSRCYICHSNTKGAANRVGPNLFGVVGRKAGAYPGFVYSPAMKKAGFVWTVPKLEAYLADPQKLVPGNEMPIAGITDPQQRADIAAYLATLK
jgi:cytochrome c